MLQSIGINELSIHANKLIRELGGRVDSILVTRHHRDLLVAIMPSRGRAMQRRSVGMREFSRSTFAVLDQVHSTGEAVTLTNRGRPVGEIVPISSDDAARYAATMAAQSSEFLLSLRHADTDLEMGEAKELKEFIDSLPEDEPSEDDAPARGRFKRQRTA